MYTTLSLEELRTTSRTPTFHLPRELSQEFDRDALYREALGMEQGCGWSATRSGIRRLVGALLGRLAMMASHMRPRRVRLSTEVQRT